MPLAGNASAFRFCWPYYIRSTMVHVPLKLQLAWIPLSYQSHANLVKYDAVEKGRPFSDQCPVTFYLYLVATSFSSPSYDGDSCAVLLSNHGTLGL